MVLLIVRRAGYAAQDMVRRPRRVQLRPHGRGWRRRGGGGGPDLDGGADRERGDAGRANGRRGTKGGIYV